MQTNAAPAENSSATPAAPRRSRDWRPLLIYVVFIGLFLLFAITLHERGFLSENNLMNIARQSAMIAIMAVGMTFVLSAAEIDLSFGAVVALSAVTAALLLPYGVVPAVAGALAAGAVCGMVNGALVSRIAIPSFLVTLGTAGIITGITRWISGLQSIPVDNDVFAFIFGSGDIGPVPVLFLWMVAIVALGHVVLRKSAFGKAVLASGGNKLAATYAGINVGRVKMWVLLLNALLASLAGILYAGRLHSARYTLGENDLMMVLTAVIIGGTHLFGGKGSVVGALVGALIMGMVNNGLILMGLDIDQQLILRGVIIICAVTLTSGRLRRPRR